MIASTLRYSTDTITARRATTHRQNVARMHCTRCDGTGELIEYADYLTEEGWEERSYTAPCPKCRPTQPTYGKCRACGAVEVRLTAADGTINLNAIGESARYPTGYGCEACD